MGTRYTEQRNIPVAVAELDLGKVNAEKFDLAEVIKIDQQLNDALKEKGTTAYAPYLTVQSWFNLNQYAPVMGARNIGDLLRTIAQPSDFLFVNAGIASSKDLAFAYGKSNKGPYLRVWSKQVSGWVLLLQVSSE